MFLPDAMSVLIETLPPSPPTTSSRKTDGSRLCLAPPIAMSTPEDSPASMPGSSNLGRKRVDFSAQINVHDAAAFASSPEQAASIKTLPPSRENRTATRSILKPPSQTEMLLESMDGQNDENLSVNETMESILQQLSKNDKHTSLDAYNTLASMFKAYDELPEAITLKRKLSTLISYIRRDVESQDQTDEVPADINLVLSAVKLLAILVWSPTFSPLLLDEHKIFILDRSIRVISEHRASKGVIVHYLSLLATQNFRPAMMTANTRANRLLDALGELPNYVTGSSVLSSTIMVLVRLIEQARVAMRIKANCWVETFFRAMMSTSPDTRQKAIAFGMKACSAFAAAPAVSATFRDMLRRDESEKTTIEVWACKRLKVMLAKAENTIQVPQIWATVLLLAVNTNDNVDGWSSLRSCWLDVIQRCFNCSDTAVKTQANFAWNRLVCLGRPHEASDSLASLLGKPVDIQVNRAGNDKQGRTARLSALSSYCNLLYYAFRPKATHKQYTRSWNEYIVKIMRRSFFEKSPANADFACKVFMALSWNSTRTTKVWKEARAHDNTEVEPEELPTIDAKWLRKNCGTVLQMFRLIFSRGSWVQTTTVEYGLVATAWKHFAKSLGEAASKEIKASTETVQACAYVVGLVQQLWQEGPQAVNSGEDDIDSLEERLSFVLRVVIAEIGPGPFADVLEKGTISLPASLLHNFASAAVDMKNSLHGASKQLGDAHLVPRSGASSIHLLEKTLSLLDKRLGCVYKASTIDRRDIDAALKLISICLRDTPESIAILTLETLQCSLQTWLEDRERSAEGMDVNEILRIEVAEKIAKVVVPSLGSLPPRMVENLDGLFAAGFRSTHKIIINQMVGMWNTSHGEVSQLIYGPDLTDALSRLRPFVQIKLTDLNLPDELSTISYGDSAPPAFLDFVETQRPLAITPIPGVDEELFKNTKSLVNHSDEGIVAEPQHGRRDSNEHEAVTASRPQSSHSTPQRSRRHKDSQLQFQPIDSSPPAGMEEESQLLTDRQKEVRERQRQEASVYFADLRTDAAPKLAKPSTSNGEKRPSTPTLPSRGLADFDNNPTASPTPRSKHQALRLEDMDAPSSPLSAQVEEEALVPETIEVLMLDEANAGEGPDLSPEEDVMMEEGPAPASKGKLSSSPKEPASLVENSHIRNAAIEVDSADVSVRDADSPLHDRAGIASPGREIVLEEDPQGSPNLSLESKGGSSPFRLTSDEIDMMSRSQLSQDLDSYVISEHGDTPEPVLLDKEHEHIEETIEPSVETTSQKKRKRRTSSTASSKKMKSQSVSRSVSEASQDTQEVLHDCIIVDTSSRMPIMEFWALKKRALNPAKSKRAVSREVSTVGHSSANATNKAPKSNAVEMPSPNSPTSAANGLVSEEKIRTIEIVIDSSLSKKGASAFEQNPTDGTKEAVPDLEERAIQNTQGEVPSGGQSELVAMDLEIPSASATSRSSDAATATEERAVPTEDTAVQTLALPQHNVSVQAEMGIIESLQDVLDRLKKSFGEGLGLRAIDDLCFQIRTEGQNAVNRGRESH